MTTQDDYLAEVARSLADLGEADRAGLLEDLAQHLDELEREGADISLRLGSPEAYAAELRAAAGLPSMSRRNWQWRRLSAFRGHPLTLQALDFARQLRPGWWLVRGYALVALVALHRADRQDDFPLPTVGGSHVLGVAVVLLAMAASVALGRRRLPRLLVPAVLVANALLVLGGATVVNQAQTRLTRTAYVHLQPVALTDRYPLVTAHGPVTNIYPYDAQGRPLAGVLLFDQDGRPLRAAVQQWWKDGCKRLPDPPKAADGVPVPFSFPQNYVVTAPAAGYATASVCAAGTRPASVPLPTFQSPKPKGLVQAAK